MNEPAVFLLVEAEMIRVVSAIDPDNWAMELPSWFQRPAAQRDATLRDIVNYHAYDDAWVPAMLAGSTMEDVGVDAFRGDLLGDAPIESFRHIANIAMASARAVTDLTTIVHCSLGDLTVQQYFWQINMFRQLRARDISRLIGIDETQPTDLVAAVWNWGSKKT